MSLTDEQLDALRTEAIRARGFVRGSETQLTKFIDMMDEMRAPTPDPDPDPDPQPDPDPDPDPDPAPDPDPPPPSGDLLFSSDWSGGRPDGRREVELERRQPAGLCRGWWSRISDAERARVRCGRWFLQRHMVPDVRIGPGAGDR